MNRSRIYLTLLVTTALALASGCGKAPSAAPPVAVADPDEPTQAQPKLQTLKLYIGTQEMFAELALTAQQERTGMMFRTNMEENAGMLFVFPEPRVASFWMKNCPLPLSAAYLDSDGVIREIHLLEPHNTNSVISATADIRFVLETPRGWFERHGIKEGVAIASERGPLHQVFFGK